MSPYTSPFFSNTTGVSGEVGLIDDLVREQIKLFGIDILYMPRRMLSLDKLLHESSKNAFELALPIPMYLKTFDGYDNGLEILSKFGVRSSDEITLQMSRSEFTTHYAPFLKSYYNANAGRDANDNLNRLEGETAHRPKEGDLIYFPFDDGIFEIKYVMFDQPFFQLGRGYVFEIQCEKFEYSGETFSTGYDKVDDTTVQPDYYRMEFDMRVDTQQNSTGSTFLQKERVYIYPLADCDISGIDGGDSFWKDVSGEVDVYTTEDDDAKVYMFFCEGGDALAIPTEIPVDGGDALADYSYCGLDLFQLYRDAGYIRRVNRVEATVELWNKPDNYLTVGDVTDLDPDRMSGETGTRPQEIDMNKFDNAMIVGQSSGAVWFSQKAGTQPKAFDDELTIQREFNDIKIDDLADSSPFGFF